MLIFMAILYNHRNSVAKDKYSAIQLFTMQYNAGGWGAFPSHLLALLTCQTVRLLIGNRFPILVWETNIFLCGR